jgi:RNA polymerase sigma-70 factor (ECF subfamily)
MKLPWLTADRAPHRRQLGDEDLMQLVAGGDPAAFDVIYERHATIAYSLAHRMCGERQVAEDVVQEAFLSVWRRAPGYDASRASVRTWLLSIVHHRAVDALRRRGNDQRRGMAAPVEDFEIDAEIRVDAEVLARERSAAVRDGLRALPPEQTRVIELAYFGGFTHLEIADMLELPVGTVKGRMRLGLTKLRSRFEPLEATP